MRSSKRRRRRRESGTLAIVFAFIAGIISAEFLCAFRLLLAEHRRVAFDAAEVLISFHKSHPDFSRSCIASSKLGRTKMNFKHPQRDPRRHLRGTKKKKKSPETNILSF